MLPNLRIGDFVSIILLLTLVASNNAFRLSPQGGYDLVLGIENPDAVTPSDQLRYVQNIKNSMQTFSNQLWRATKMRFHINSMELIVPESWTSIHDDEATYAELGGIQTADFRISPSVSYPSAKNPYLCGLPGDYVELPFNFFNSANSNEFGANWKTLMVLFSRYRFGVWEEHGFIGDEVFPYFFQNSTSASWETTGCNNEPLIGKFVNVTDVDQRLCEMEWSTPQSNLGPCRFIPDPVENKVTTSLMHFHWLESVVDFCDENTHNTLADNKQNAFCDRKSIMQVIRESPDYAVVTNPRVEVPAIAFNTVKQSAKPLLYILMDRGLIQGDDEVAALIPPALVGFVNRATLQNVIAGVGSFPNPDNAAIQLKQEVGWSQIGTNLERFREAVGELTMNGPVQRDFSRAILEVAALIKTRGHTSGAVIFVIKLGADMENLNKTIPEKDVLLALNDQKIILHSMELAMTGVPPVAQLSQLVSDTAGSFTTLINVFESPTAITGILGLVANTVNSDVYFTDAPTTRTVAKQVITSAVNGVQVTLPPSAKLADVFYTSVHLLTRDNFTTLIDNVVVGPSFSGFRRSEDWRAEGIAGYSYRFRFSQTAIAGKTGVVVQLNCAGLPGCVGEMVGRVVIDETITKAVKIDVTTTSNDIDLSQNTPLTIYAKAMIDGVPIRNYNDTVIYAEAILTNDVTSYTVVLHDDGSIPDILETDGTFSAYFVPPRDGDGDYKITVRFIKQTGMSLLGESVRESSLGRLLPIDQSPGGSCEVTNTCPETPVDNGFVQIGEPPSPISFSNSNSFTARPGKIILFYNISSLTLSWRSPRVPGFSTNTAVNSYEIRQSQNRRDLLENFDNCTIVATVDVTAPGTWQSVQHPIPLYSMHYGIKSFFLGSTSELSNIRTFPATQQTTPTPPPTSVDPSNPTNSPTTPGSSTPGPSNPSPTTTTPTPSIPPTTPISTIDPSNPTTTSSSTPAQSTPTSPSSTPSTSTIPTTTDSFGVTIQPKVFLITGLISVTTLFKMC